MKGSVTVSASPVVDLLVAMYRVTNAHREQEDRRDINREITVWVNITANDMDQKLKSELDVFFHQESYFGLLTVPLVIFHNAHLRIGDFLQMLDQLEPTALLNAFINTGLPPQCIELDFQDSYQVLEHIRKLFIPEAEKWKLFYLIHDGRETKRRFIELIKRFYTEYYQSKENEFHQKQLAYVNDLDTNDPRLNQLFASFDMHEDERDIVLLPSYTLGSGIIVSSVRLFCVLGTHYFDVHEIARDEKDILEVLKVLADEQRVRLLQLLNKRPHYGMELAQLLGVSNSTVSHHISALLEHKLITSKRIENKVYFKTNQSEMTNVLEQIQALFK